jgi:glycosyltransferase involved in cell wall biosynthesis
MRTIVATAYTPSLDSGRARRAYGLIRALAEHGPVDLVYNAFGAPEPDPAFAAIDGVALHRIERPSRPSHARSYLRARLAGVPAPFARGVWPGFAGRAKALAEGEDGSRLVAQGPIAAAALLGAAKRRPAVYCADNLESTFRHRLERETLSQEALERFEQLLLQTFSENWMVSDLDVEGAAEMAPASKQRLVPNVVDVSAIEPLERHSGECSLLFVADLTYDPNVQALRFLCDQVMPALWRSREDARLLVAGRGSTDFDLPADPRIEAQGFVPELRDLYAGAGCVVVPLLEGGGSPLKFVEALAYGAAIVATPRAAAGLHVTPGREYVEAEPEGAAFAAAVEAALVPGRADELGAAARRLAESEYSIEALVKDVAP